ncbi:hypothetical protein [Streptomyces lomondensis]|uniref:PE-PGRS family protein n=1 Tax=Streptomyces lomondensis TaxID=68229 RepID=A0ABQ2XRH8_9ACTN|nr:hypothetical protein [Streptomyces lomondensis]MCF0080743.1 hypothetical protein [Streptomyces lomondensis]GGX28501.1 hypothetical protein GCM10010383_68840 [Streptomyces lomondensis]
MRRPVEGEVHVHYGQIYVKSDPDGFGPDLAEAFAGQSTGLCGAAVPGALWLNTGLHTGNVGFTVEVHEQAPPLDPAWEDVVEVSFRPASADSRLVQWAGEASWPLGLAETEHRVRYCAQGMDEARDEDTRLHDEPQRDRYLLQFWPAPPEPDRVLKQTSRSAAYWHGYARELPPPPTPAERAEAERRARLAQEAAVREHLLAHERWTWGGRLPSEALRAVGGGGVRGLLRFDPALVHAIDAAGPATQRKVALLAARRACEAAGLTALDWVADALTALAEGRPLPPPFDDETRMWQTLATDPRLPDRTVGRAVPPERPPFQPPGSTGVRMPPSRMVVGPAAAVAKRPGPPMPMPSGSSPYGLVVTAGPPTPLPSGSSGYGLVVTARPPDPAPRLSQPHMALPAVTGAAEDDPLRAALDAVDAAVAAYGEDHPTLLAEIRSVCEERPSRPPGS